MINGKTRLYGIIGDPVSHTLSPAMQNTALAAAGINAVYLPFHVHPEQLATAISGLKGLQVAGFNVTIPHKSSIIPLLDRLADSAAQAGAVNTVVNQNGILTGHNTDGDGMIRGIKQELKLDICNKKVILLGGGGAARGALAALCRNRAASVLLLNRTVSAVELLVQQFAPLFPDTALRCRSLDCDCTTDLTNCDLLINATSAGMDGGGIKGVDTAFLPDHAAVYDMVYSPPVTRLMADARIRGLQGANGLSMLIAQGELAFELWHGSPPPTGIMAAALANP